MPNLKGSLCTARSNLMDSHESNPGKLSSAGSIFHFFHKERRCLRGLGEGLVGEEMTASEADVEQEFVVCLAQLVMQRRSCCDKNPYVSE